MKVLLVSTSERNGGGAIAARRLLTALHTQGVEAKMMVRDKQTDDKAVVRVGNKLPKLLERLKILPGLRFRRSRLWLADTASHGIDITRTPEFQEADVVHLHWTSQGMISIKGLNNILSSGKRVVWTLHDEWPYLGVCHYRAECTQPTCMECPILSGSTPGTTWHLKHKLYERWHPTFVGCSHWITQRAQQALQGEHVVHINNCVPSSLFHPIDMAQARRRLSLPERGRLLLFCSQKVTDERKGIAFLVKALQHLRDDDLRLLIVGKGSEKIPLPDTIPATRFPSVGEDTMPLLYNAADVYVTPSLQDNLPNTIAEAMRCGTPCVGFNAGGIPEMIDHTKNGYVARYRDAEDLADGILYVLSHDLREAACRKAARDYDEQSVALQYIKLYQN